MGLGVSTITEVAGQTAHASDINSNNASIVGANSPIFDLIRQTSGVSESGKAGGTGYVPGAGQNTGFCVNFKRTMINTPSSITLSAGFTSNVGSVAATAIDTLGFNLQMPGSSTGLVTWQGLYSTNGNCLLEVHPGKDTFHHHCDICGEYNLHIKLSALRVDTSGGEAPGESALCFECPVCESRRSEQDRKKGRGAVTESWNTALFSAEEEEGFAPEHPGRHLQVRVIRAVQQILGLPVHP